MSIMTVDPKLAQQMQRRHDWGEGLRIPRNNIIVVRVETEDGVGAYLHSYTATAASEGKYHHNPEGVSSCVSHPSPWGDSFKGEWQRLQADGEYKNWFFGFADVAQLLQWWNTPMALKRLEEDGLILREYECEPGTVITGDKQIIFRRCMAKPGQAIQLSTLMSHPSIQHEVEEPSIVEIVERRQR